MRKKEMRLLLEERYERITLLESRIDTMEQLIDGYRAREQAIIDTLHDAHEAATRSIDQATTKAQDLLGNAERQAADLRAAAEQSSTALQEEAETRAQFILSDAKSESDRLLRDAEVVKREYEELAASFNEMLDQNAQQLKEATERFTDYIKQKKVELPEHRIAGEQFYKTVGAMNTEELPDASEDPAVLMQNIYRLQNRSLPDFTVPAAVVPAALLKEEEEETAAPYSENAWQAETFESESEPQAEFTPAFDPAFPHSEADMNVESCISPADLAERAYGIAATERTPIAAAEAQSEAQTIEQAEAPDFMPEETTQQAAHEEFPETEEEIQQAADATISEEMPAVEAEPNLEPEPDTEEGAHAEGARAFDDYFASLESKTETQTGTEEQPATGESIPYSEHAWASETHVSGTEPQAEGEQAFDAFFERSEGRQPAEDTPEIEPETESLDLDTTEPDAAEPNATETDAYTRIHEMIAEAENEQQTDTAEPAVVNPSDERPQAPELGWIAETRQTYDESDAAEETAGNVASDAEPEPQDATLPAADDQPVTYEYAGTGGFNEINTYSDGLNAGDEPREWEPEPEPDMGDIPTVSQYMGQENGQKEVTLDELLDEIIKAGE